VYKKPTTYKKLSESEFNSLFNKEYSQAKNANEIFRGMRYCGDLVLTHPSKRISQNTSNVYTRLMSDILPSWSEYPKRSESFICSTSKCSASSYGSYIYQLFPLNNTKIGVCPTLDIWLSFNIPNSDNLDEFNNSLIKFLHHIDIYDKFTSLSEISKIFRIGSKQSILNMLEYFDRIIDYNTDKLKEIISSDSMIEYLENFNKYGILNYLDKLLNPNKNDFKLLNISNFYDLNYKNHEVWFSASCLGRLVK